jgi:hypothetical protein
MKRRADARARSVWARLRRTAVHGDREELGELWMRLDPDPSRVADATEPGVPAVDALVVDAAGDAPARIASPFRVPPVPPVPPTKPAPPAPPTVAVPAVADRDDALVDALHRVADSFERIAESLEADRLDRRARFDDVDGLLHELVNGLARPTAVPPVVIGGSIESGELEAPGAAGALVDLTRDEIAPAADTADA